MEPMIDLDDYINSLTDRIHHLENLTDSLRKEIRTQRKEIANLREERRVILNQDLPPEYNTPLELK